MEAGGTKFRLAVGTGPDDILAETRIETTDPEATLGAVVDWLAGQGNLSAIGVASFGPLDLDPASTRWGHITKTPKAGWQYTDLAGYLHRALDVPVALETDVNAAAMAESRWGAGHGYRTIVYVTVGTGIGGGLVVDGVPHRGLSHPEMGHFRPRLNPSDLSFSGVCPFHGNCLEGLASGPAILARWCAELSDLATGHPAHEIIADYLAQLVIALQAMLQPGRVILGGGVMATPGLLGRVQSRASELGNGYFQGLPDEVLTLPALGDRSGLLGALALAQSSKA